MRWVYRLIYQYKHQINNPGRRPNNDHYRKTILSLLWPSYSNEGNSVDHANHYEQQIHDDANNNDMLVRMIIGFLIIILLQIVIGRFPTTFNKSKQHNMKKKTDDDNDVTGVNNVDGDTSIREIKRRIQHATTGHGIVLLSYMLSLQLIRYGQIIMIIVMIILYYIHQYHFHTLYMKIAGPYLRPNELLYVAVQNNNNNDQKNNKTTNYSRGVNLPGAWYFLLGVLISSSIFPLYIAQYSIMCLSYSDPIASYIGQTIPSIRLIDIIMKLSNDSSTLSYQQHQQRKQQRKQSIIYTSNATLYGSISCFISSLIIGYIMLLQKQHNTIIMFLIITIGALTCTLCEAFPILYHNDNITIPIITSFVVTTLITIINSIS